MFFQIVDTKLQLPVKLCKQSLRNLALFLKIFTKIDFF